MNEQTIDKFMRALRAFYTTEQYDRAMQEWRFARLYDEEFQHGTDGHNRLMLLSNIMRVLEEGTWNT